MLFLPCFKICIDILSFKIVCEGVGRVLLAGDRQMLWAGVKELFRCMQYQEIFFDPKSIWGRSHHATQNFEEKVPVFAQ